MAKRKAEIKRTGYEKSQSYRQQLEELADELLKKTKEDIDKLEPKERVRLLTRILPFICSQYRTEELVKPVWAQWEEAM